MNAIRTNLRRLRRDDRGATAIEYGLIVALISVAMMAALGNLVAKMDANWSKIDNAVQNS